MAICLTIFTFGKLVMLDAYDPQAICQTVERERVSAIVWVPTLAARLIQSLGDAGSAPQAGIAAVNMTMPTIW